MELPLKNITVDNFSPFGKVLEMTPDGDDRFQIVITEEKDPWRLAVFRYRNHEINMLEAHPTTLESFEPLSGISVLLVAPPENPNDLHAFLLDKPVCLYKNIWHQTLALTEEAQVKIAENLDVPGTQFHHLEHPLSVFLADCFTKNRP